MSIYVLGEPDPPWGDYGSILIHGMTQHLARKGDLLQLERMGPFVPPITQPGLDEIIVTDQFRKQLEASGLTGFTFRPVIKKRIVRLQWETWDRTADDPARYPAGGEPENYILGHRHSPELADQMGDLREVVIDPTVAVERIGTWPNVAVYLDLSSWTGADFFREEGIGYTTYVSDRARNWLERTAGEWVRFEQPPTR